jgi:hypothetical protein
MKASVQLDALLDELAWAASGFYETPRTLYRSMEAAREKLTEAGELTPLATALVEGSLALLFLQQGHARGMVIALHLEALRGTVAAQPLPRHRA